METTTRENLIREAWRLVRQRNKICKSLENGQFTVYEGVVMLQAVQNKIDAVISQIQD